MTQAEMTQLSNQEALAASTCAKTYADHTRNYVIYNAYLRYNYKDIFQIRGGRYESPADYMSGYNQGLDMTLNLGNFKFWWFSSFGRGFAYNEWLYNFYSPKTYTLKNGQTINPGCMPFISSGITRVSAFSLLSIFHLLTNTTPTLRLLMIVTPLLPD